MNRILYLFFLVSTASLAQVGIGTITPDTSSALDISSTSAGILIPRMTETQRTGISSPATGLLVYQTNNTAGFWYYDGSNWSSLSAPAASNGWNVDGNSGTNPSTNFIGTTDDQDLVFKRNNEISGLLGDTNTGFGYQTLSGSFAGSGNTALGYRSLNSITNANNNTAIGYNALEDNTTGHSNTSVGSLNMFNNLTGSSNTALGYNCLKSNTSGNGNVALGYSAMINADGVNFNIGIGISALQDNTSGNDNIAIGRDSMENSSTGNDNIAIGRNALRSAAGGSQNIAMGLLSMQDIQGGNGNIAIGYGSFQYNVSGDANIAIGQSSMENNQSGDDNMAFGMASLRANTTGFRNTAIGYGSLGNNTTGYHNTGLGYGSGPSSSGLNNSTAIGYGASATSNNSVRIGNLSVNSIGGYANWTNVSDGRFKTNVNEDVAGLDFILKLRPVTYNLDMDAIARFNKIPDSLRLREAEQLKSKEIQSGFIAQEVEKAAKQAGYDFHGVDTPKNQESHYGLRYAEFVVPLVKGMQEQQHIIDEQQKVIKNLKERLDRLEAIIESSDSKL